MKRTKAVIQKEIESIREQITKLEAESAALDYLVQVEDVVPGAAFKDKDFVVFVVHDAAPNMYRLSGNEQVHPCSLFSDSPLPRAAMAQYLSQHFPNKVLGKVEFIPGTPRTKAGDVLDGIRPTITGTRLVRVYPDGTVKLYDEKDVSCNSFSSLASLNRQLDSKFPMYTRRA